LQGHVTANRFVPGQWHRLAAPIADLTHKPDQGPATQLIFGDRFLVLDTQSGHSFGQSQKDGYVGYVRTEALGSDIPPTHHITALSSHIYPEPHFKSPMTGQLPFGAQITAVETIDGFYHLAAGGFIPHQHARAVGDCATDPTAMAERMIGTPYLWGGSSIWGIDCSGLVQAAFLACATPCPRDSDQQRAGFGDDLPPDAPLMRGDLVFWKGHVGLMRDSNMLLHANAHHMAVASEPLTQAEARILANEFGPIIARKRVR
jgi:cell wall-associated NlpC family hydrolase